MKSGKGSSTQKTSAPSKGSKGGDSKHSGGQHGPSKEMKDTFFKKVQFCSQSFDFNDETKQTKEKVKFFYVQISLKNDRITYLQELSDLLNDQNTVTSLIIPHLDLVMEMIEKNIFRPLPMLKKAGAPTEGMGGVTEMPQEDELLIDPAWPHLQLVYEFFLGLIVNEACDVKSLKVFVTHQFIQEFLELLDSEEPKEREYLKNILHRLYAKLVPRRKMIRKAMNDSFSTLIHETYKFNGASEVLDILAALQNYYLLAYFSIISGFAVPLREEHIIFFKNIIAPLHKVKKQNIQINQVQTCHLFHEQLLRCSMLFLSKDPTLAFYLVESLLRYWPIGNSVKEVMFLTELVEVLEVCEIAKLEPLITKLFKRLIKCIAGPHLQVADRAMCFFENDFFLTILKNYKSITFPLLVPVINQIADNHWHKVLQESLNALKTILKEIDSVAFDKALNIKDPKILNILADPKTQKQQRQKLEDKWTALYKQAKMSNANLKEPDLPYVENHVVGQHNRLENGNAYFLQQ